jgi:hypothetical protein
MMSKLGEGGMPQFSLKKALRVSCFAKGVRSTLISVAIGD